jgi:transposase-like protein
MKGVYFMKKKVKVSPEQKIQAVGDYISGKKSLTQILYEMSIAKTAF